MDPCELDSESAANAPRLALLIVGPTGSGKTPLGDYLNRNGLQGTRCSHLDFGTNLRRTAAGGIRPSALTDADVDVIVHSLKSGALLENENFHIAAKILRDFVSRRKLGPDDLIVLNGLPRHLGQAADMDRLVDIKTIVCLDCLPGVLHERIVSNAGGDRAGRTDDSPSAVACKLKVFQNRTVPLVDHYRRRGAVIRRIKVEVATTPRDILRQLKSEATGLPGSEGQ